LAERQAERGLEVSVLVTGAGPTATRTERGVRVIRAHRSLTLASTPLSLDLVRSLPRLEADVRHLHLPYPLADVAEIGARRRGGGALVVTYHCDVVRQKVLGRLYRPLLRRLLARADRVLVSSERMLESAKALAAVRDRCVVVPYGIDPRGLEGVDAGEVAALRERYPGPRVLFVGRLRHYKGVAVLLRAVEQIEGTLLIAGSGPMERAWRQAAAASPAQERIHFVGHLDDDALALHYHAADVFALPSDRRAEAFGLVLLEAMACGTPVVSTELGTGTSDVNRHGETGLVVPPGDAEALAGALRTLLGDDALRARLGATARRRVRAAFDPERMVAATIDAYADALEGRRSRAAPPRRPQARP
ncbi:MAG: glycosyltransferase, partial [Thermoanaerobaculia bacterium]|nr:glycosyltransferase [Thermoanaerobaculia bacterium]